MVKVKANVKNNIAQEPGMLGSCIKTGRGQTGAGHGPAASPGSSLEMQTVGPHPC